MKQLDVLAPVIHKQISYDKTIYYFFSLYVKQLLLKHCNVSHNNSNDNDQKMWFMMRFKITPKKKRKNLSSSDISAPLDYKTIYENQESTIKHQIIT